MTTYICQWEGKAPDEIEYDEFSVEETPDHYPGKWKCRYRYRYKDYVDDSCWSYVPSMRQVGTTWVNTNPKQPAYMLEQEVLNRDLTCVAIGWTCELISIERVETEPRLPSLIRLALQIENGRATLMNREPRKFLRFTNPPDA